MRILICRLGATPAIFFAFCWDDRSDCLMTRISKNQRERSGRRASNASPAGTIPTADTIAELREAAAGCTACDLWKRATQTVFGEGSSTAKIMFVGEQPGDQEDRTGHPFVGPAGRLLNEALAEAGIERADVYVTNVVKHFKWTRSERSKRRIHKKPRYSEIQACRPWLEAEIRVVKPQVLVCLGASAAQSLLGRGFSVNRQSGQLAESVRAPYVTATVHPSSILRAPDSKARQSQLEAFISDLKKVARLAERRRAA